MKETDNTSETTTATQVKESPSSRIPVTKTRGEVIDAGTSNWLEVIETYAAPSPEIPADDATPSIRWINDILGTHRNQTIDDLLLNGPAPGHPMRQAANWFVIHFVYRHFAANATEAERVEILQLLLRCSVTPEQAIAAWLGETVLPRFLNLEIAECLYQQQKPDSDALTQFYNQFDHTAQSHSPETDPQS